MDSNSFLGSVLWTQIIGIRLSSRSWKRRPARASQSSVRLTLAVDNKQATGALSIAIIQPRNFKEGNELVLGMPSSYRTGRDGRLDNQARTRRPAAAC